jgi:sugar (pentulose or hexulose) kinase
MENQGIDVSVVLKPHDVMYLSGWAPVCSGLLVFRQSPPVEVCIWLDGPEGKKNRSFLQIAGYRFPESSMVKKMAGLIRERLNPPLSIGIEKDFMTVHFLETIQSAFPQAGLVSITRALDEMRAIKTPEEIRSLKKATVMAEAGMKAALAAVRPGVTEIDIAAEATGIPAGVPVTIGAADTPCSALGAGIVEPGEIFDSAGTSDIVALCSTKPLFDSHFLNRCHSVGDLWLLMGATSSPDGALAWLGDQFCSLEKEEERATGVDAYDLICAQAEKAAPGSGKVFFLPFMSGERSPIWDPQARDVFVGLSLATTRGEVIRAVLEGGAYAVRQNVEIAEQLLSSSIEELRAVGGGSKSRVWAQIRSDVRGKRLRTLHFREIAVLGAAMLGGIGAGIFADYHGAVQTASPSKSDTFEPRAEGHAYYDQLYTIYRKLYPALRDSYQLLAEVPN